MTAKIATPTPTETFSQKISDALVKCYTNFPTTPTTPHTLARLLETTPHIVVIN